MGLNPESVATSEDVVQPFRAGAFLRASEGLVCRGKLKPLFNAVSIGVSKLHDLCMSSWLVS